MSRWTLGLLGCCAKSSHSSNSEWEPPLKHLPLRGSEHGTAASTHRVTRREARKDVAQPAPELLVDSSTGLLGLMARPRTPPRTRDPEEKATARAELQQLVHEFSEEASLTGRSCVAIDLNMESSNVGPRRIARYRLADESMRFMLLGCEEDGLSPSGEVVGTWLLSTIMGAHRAEESASVQTRRSMLLRLMTQEELQRSVVLDFGGPGCSARSPVLIIEESGPLRDRFISAMSVLHLYHRGVARREDAARRRRGVDGSHDNVP